MSCLRDSSVDTISPLVNNPNLTFLTDLGLLSYDWKDALTLIQPSSSEKRGLLVRKFIPVR